MVKAQRRFTPGEQSSDGFRAAVDEITTALTEKLAPRPGSFDTGVTHTFRAVPLVGLPTTFSRLSSAERIAHWPVRIRRSWRHRGLRSERSFVIILFPLSCPPLRSPSEPLFVLFVLSFLVLPFYFFLFFLFSCPSNFSSPFDPSLSPPFSHLPVFVFLLETLASRTRFFSSLPDSETAERVNF